MSYLWQLLIFAPGGPIFDLILVKTCRFYYKIIVDGFIDAFKPLVRYKTNFDKLESKITYPLQTPLTEICNYMR